MSGRTAYIIGGLIGAIVFGGVITFAVFNGDTSKEIPDDYGTLGGAFSAMMGSAWDSIDYVKNTAKLGGVEANYYVQRTTPGDIVCNNGSTATNLGAKFGSGLIQQIKSNGTPVCGDQLASNKTILKPILATIRDLDGSCYNQVKVNGISLINSDPFDIHEGDSIETTASCSMASLYFIDHSIVRLAPSTTLALRSAGTANGSGATDVSLTSGELWARVLKPITDDSYFNISSDEGSVGVRGTSVYIKRESGGGLTVLPMDSGTLPDDKLTTGGVVNIIPKGSADIKSVRLNDRTTFSAVTSPPATEGSHGEEHGTRRLVSTESTSTSDTYTYNDFIRRATLADLRDWDDLYRFDRGNLKTISMTGSWLIANSGAIQTGIGYTSNPQGIDKNEPKVLKEFTRTEPIDTIDAPEIDALCEGGGRYISRYLGCLKSGEIGVDFTDTSKAPRYDIIDNTGRMVAQELDQSFDAPTSTGYTYTSSGTNGKRLLQYPINGYSGGTIDFNVGDYNAKDLDTLAFIRCDDSTPRTKAIQFKKDVISFAGNIVPGNICVLTLGRNTVTGPTSTLADSGKFKGSIRSLIIRPPGH